MINAPSGHFLFLILLNFTGMAKYIWAERTSPPDKTHVSMLIFMYLDAPLCYNRMQKEPT